MVILNQLYMHFKTRSDKKRLVLDIEKVIVGKKEIRYTQEKLIDDSHKVDAALRDEVARYQIETNDVAKAVIKSMILDMKENLEQLRKRIPLLASKIRSYDAQKNQMETLLIELKNPSNIDRVEELHDNTKNMLATLQQERYRLDELKDLSDEADYVTGTKKSSRRVSDFQIDQLTAIPQAEPVDPEFQEILDTYK